MLRQNGIFDRPKNGRMHTHQENDDQRQRHRLEQHRHRAKRHEDDLRQLHAFRNPRLVARIGDFTGQPRKQHERQDEHTRGHCRKRCSARRVIRLEMEGDEKDESGLEQIIVEGAQKLGSEHRPETARKDK